MDVLNFVRGFSARMLARAERERRSRQAERHPDEDIHQRLAESTGLDGKELRGWVSASRRSVGATLSSTAHVELACC